MLVLSRQTNESIVIGDNIVVTVIEIRGDKVRLGIQADKEVSVHRSEVYLAIHGKEAMSDGILQKDRVRNLIDTPVQEQN